MKNSTKIVTKEDFLCNALFYTDVVLNILNMFIYIYCQRIL